MYGMSFHSSGGIDVVPTAMKLEVLNLTLGPDNSDLKRAKRARQILPG
jgi:hypothetical protein